MTDDIPTEVRLYSLYCGIKCKVESRQPVKYQCNNFDSQIVATSLSIM